MDLDLSTLPDVTAGLSAESLETVEVHLRAELDKIERDPLNNLMPPHIGQERVHVSTSKHILLISANRWGKSICGMREALWRATNTHPYKRIRPHRMIWCGFPDFKFFNKTTKPIFDLLCPKDYLLDFNETKYRATFRREGGGTCEMFFMSYDQDRKTWQGGAVDHLWFDEEHPEDISKEGMARVITTSGDVLRTLTPVEGLAWIYDQLYLPAKERKKKIELIEGALAEYRPECKCGHMPEQHDANDGCDRCHCGKYAERTPFKVGRVLVPHLNYEQVLRFAEEIPDEDERAVRIFGQYRGRSGGVYKMFAVEVHVIPAFEVPSHWEMWGAVDPGYHGFAVTFYAMAPDGRIYCVGEYFSQEETTSVRFEALSALYRRIRPEEITTDPCVLFVDTEDPQTVLELNIQAAEAEAPLAFASLDQGLKARKAGIFRVQQALAPSNKRSTPAEVARPRPDVGEPMLYLFDSLYSEWRDDDETLRGSRLVWELQRYLWKKPKKGTTVKPDEPDKESAAGGHALDTLRYAIQARLGAPEPLEEEKRPHLPDWQREVWEYAEELEADLVGPEGY